MIPLPKLALNATALKLILGLACALALALLVHDRNRWKAKTAHYAQVIAAERGAHAATAANVRAATERARRLDSENAARVRAAQTQINERTSDAFESRIAAARAVAHGLRRAAKGAAADPGGGGTAPVPGLPAAAQGAAQAAGKDGLSEADRLIATEQAIQLDELILWVRAQGNVEVSRD